MMRVMCMSCETEVPGENELAVMTVGVNKHMSEPSCSHVMDEVTSDGTNPHDSNDPLSATRKLDKCTTHL